MQSCGQTPPGGAYSCLAGVAACPISGQVTHKGPLLALSPVFRPRLARSTRRQGLIYRQLHRT
jgi:hypothetical protein